MSLSFNMADAPPLDIPPEDVSSQTAKCEEESTYRQVQAIDSESQRIEPNKQNFDCNVVQNELWENCKASSDSAEQSPSFSENLTENSHLQQLGRNPEDVNKSSHEAGNVFTKSIEQGHKISSQHIHYLQTTTAITTCTMNNQSQSFCGNVAMNSFTEQLKIPREDLVVDSKTGKTSCPGEMSLEQTNDSVLGNSCIDPAGVEHPSGSEFIQNELSQNIIPVPMHGSNEQWQLISENVNVTSFREGAGQPPEDVSKNGHTEKISSSHQTTEQHINKFLSGGALRKPEKQKDLFDPESAQNDEAKSREAVSSSIVCEQWKSSIETMTRDSLIGHLEVPLPNANKSPGDREKEPTPQDASQRSTPEHVETPPDELKDSSWLEPKDKQNPKSRKKYNTRSYARSDRVLRSRTGEKPKDRNSSNNGSNLDASNNVANVTNGEENKRRKKRKRRQQDRVIADEFSRIRKHLRYFLNRISYEKSLIDAYSGEGWKGSSLEKLKPEKELQRATSEILQRKLKIRDLFQSLDSLCAEGMFPESLFDSEGQIDSEDIFCAKCGSREVSLDNDIILCDGACDRGFHQFCLEPPLLSEEIPPNDEGWLCPGCDCKVDCIDLLNESQATELSVTDSWEKVFPEAAAAASAGQNQEHNNGLSSDDSDDNDYDPDGPKTNDRVQRDESSSGDSEYASASDGLETSKCNDKQYLGLSSDDSEDDNYDPDATDSTLDVNQQSSSSDFTSDSEDLGAALDHNNMSSEDFEGPNSMSLDGRWSLKGSGQQSTKRGKKKHPLKDELLSLLNSGPGQDGSATVSERRHIVRLDYKKLHDETYGNVSTDSSDDEEWSDAPTARKGKKGTGQFATRSLNGNTSEIQNGVTKYIKPDQDENEISPRRTHRKSKVEDTSNLSNKSPKGSKSGSASGRAGSSRSYSRLGEAVTERLCKSFKENHYPDRSMKESLAQELGLMAKQVSKWFENARHCLKVGVHKSASENNTPLPQTSRKQVEKGDSDCSGARNKDLPTDDPMMGCCSGDVKDSQFATLKSRAKPVSPKNGKRKCKADDLDSKIETPKPHAEPETKRKGSRVMTRGRKSVS